MKVSLRHSKDILKTSITCNESIFFFAYPRKSMCANYINFAVFRIHKSLSAKVSTYKVIGQNAFNFASNFVSLICFNEELTVGK